MQNEETTEARTPTMMKMLSHKTLKMKEKGLMIYEEKGEILQSPPLVEPKVPEPIVNTS